MKTTAQRVFAKRVQTATSLCLLIGVAASLNMTPEPTRAHMVTEHHMVVPPPAVAGPLAAPAPVRPQPGPAAPAARRHNFAQMNEKQRVVAWFTEYDDIRRDAQMSPAEKAGAIKMWATSFVSAGPAETSDARILLSRMVQRYDQAGKRLSALPEIPETKSLQRGYLTFFHMAKGNFQRYLNTLNTGSLKATVAQTQAGKQELSVVDVRNKSLDRKIRERYHIQQID